MPAVTHEELETRCGFDQSTGDSAAAVCTNSSERLTLHVRLWEGALLENSHGPLSESASAASHPSRLEFCIGIMARRGQGDDGDKNGDESDGPPWFWYFFAGLCLLSILAARLRQPNQEHNTLLSLTPRVEQMCLRPIGGVPLPFVGNTDGGGTWNDISTALARGTAPDHLLILVNIDPEAEQLPEVQAPLQDIDDIDPADPEEDNLELLLLLGEVVGLPRQIERDEANMVGRPQVPQPIAEEDAVPLILVPDVADGGVPLPFVRNIDGDETWYDIGTALARGTTPNHLVILVNIDPEAEQLPEVQAPLQDIDDINTVDPAEADLDILLVQGEVVGLLQQIQRDEANIVTRPDQVLLPIDDIDPVDPTEADLDILLVQSEVVGLLQQIQRDEANIVTRPDQVLLPIAEEATVPLSLVPDEAAGVSENMLIHPAVQQALEPADRANDSASREVESAVLQVQNEANTVSRPQVPRTSTSEGSLVPLDLVGGIAVRGPEHLPTVLQGPESVADDALEDDIDAVDVLEDDIDADDAAENDIDALDALTSEILAGEASEHVIIPVDAPEPEITGTDGLEPDIGAADISAAGNSAIAALDLPQQIERDEANTNLLELKKVEDEVGEPSVGPSVQRLLQLASSDGDPGHFRVATPSLSVPAGDLNSQLEVHMPSAVTKGGVTEAEATLLEEN